MSACSKSMQGRVPGVQGVRKAAWGEHANPGFGRQQGTIDDRIPPLFLGYSSAIPGMGRQQVIIDDSRIASPFHLEVMTMMPVFTREP